MHIKNVLICDNLQDFTGRKGTLRSGDIQWMTAGRGIVHSEMPGPVDTRGLQLWVNLKSDLKMCEPTYQEIEAKDIPSKSENGITVKGKSWQIIHL